MSLTPDILVGYLRAEFAKSGRIRVALFIVQLLAALPAAISVVLPDQEKILHYILAIAGIVLLVVWWGLNKEYVKARSAANAARRAALLLSGLNEKLSASEARTLRNRFTVPEEKAKTFENADYYATKENPGPARLAEMIEESSLYSEYLQQVSARIMLGILLIFAILIIGIALASIPTIERDTGMLIARIILALMVFILSGDVFGAWQHHRSAAAEIKEISNRLMVAEKAGYPIADVMLAFSDYNSAIEGCPESVPLLYYFSKKKLERRWNIHQADRAADRLA